MRDIVVVVAADIVAVIVVVVVVVVVLVVDDDVCEDVTQHFRYSRPRSNFNKLLLPKELVASYKLMKMITMIPRTRTCTEGQKVGRGGGGGGGTVGYKVGVAIRRQAGGKGGGTGGGGKTGDRVIAVAGCRAVLVATGAHNGCRAREGRWRWR
ncbi:hypothetical protein M0802_014322 [Mischocyttarus mexicanus]|nr:hypothetical protein M0802_014322 [Mischocyttarus mexicanus]